MMSHLSKLKIVAQQQRRLQTKTEHRRAKLLEKLEEQLTMVEALIAGQLFTRNRRIWRTNEAGERVQIERPKRMRSWYWMGAGGCYLSVWYGSKQIEFKPGMAAIQVAKREELPDAIRSVMDAVRLGELDIQIEDVAEKGVAELRSRIPLRPARKAG
jgi:hypothetical protein